MRIQIQLLDSNPVLGLCRKTQPGGGRGRKPIQAESGVFRIYSKPHHLHGINNSTPSGSQGPSARVSTASVSRAVVVALGKCLLLMYLDLPCLGLGGGQPRF